MQQAARSLHHARFVPFAYGFRPFFLAACAYAMLALAGWLWIRSAGLLPLPDFPPQLWHAHEMLFGFIGAAIAGFLLTAVPSWTGARGFAGTPLVILTLFWLAGRLAFATASHLPLAVVFVAELAFLPMLAVLIAPPLLRAQNRNTPLLLVILALWVCDAAFLLGMQRGDLLLSSMSIRAGINLVLLLITVIGGRIVPAFTGNALRQSGRPAEIRSARWLDGVCIALMAANVVVDIAAPAHALAAAIAAAASSAHFARLAQWQGQRTLSQPIVWVLHVAYVWLPIGLALKAIYLVWALPWAAQWLHALTMGAAGMMIVAVITRAALGHTGRPLVVSRTVAAAYVALAIAVLLRTFGAPALGPEASIWIAGVLWIGAFVLILFIYAPILTRPRVDGRPG